MFSRLFSKRQDPDRMAQDAISDYGRDHDELDVIRRLEQAIALGLKQLPLDHAYLNIGAAYDDIGKFAEAEAAYLKALECNADNATVLSNLGILYATRGEHAKAQSNYERAIALDPTHAKYKSNLASLYMDQARYEEARQVLTLAVEKDPNVSVYALANLARCHAYLEDFAGAQAAFGDASRRGYKNVSALQQELRTIHEELSKVHCKPRALRALAIALAPGESECLALLDGAIAAPMQTYRDLATKGRAFFLEDYLVAKVLPWLLLCDELVRREHAIPWSDRSLDVWSDVFQRLWARSGRHVSAENHEALCQAAATIEADATEQGPADEEPDSDAQPSEGGAFERFIVEVSNQFDAVVVLLSESSERDLVTLLPRVTWERLAYPFVDAGDGCGSVRVLSEPGEARPSEPVH